MTILEDIQKKITGWNARWEKIDEILDNTNLTLKETKNAVNQMKDAFADISNLVKEVNKDYEQLKVKLDVIETKIKNNWWMRLFGLGD